MQLATSHVLAKQLSNTTSVTLMLP